MKGEVELGDEDDSPSPDEMKGKVGNGIVKFDWDIIAMLNWMD
jgi:hypothetical protein